MKHLKAIKSIAIASLVTFSMFTAVTPKAQANQISTDCLDLVETYNDMMLENLPTAIRVTVIEDHYGNCVMETVELNKVNPMVKHFAQIAIDSAADKNDYDSALINLKRAYEFAVTPEELKVVYRLYIGAAGAKDMAQQGKDSYLMWYSMTGILSQYD